MNIQFIFIRIKWSRGDVPNAIIASVDKRVQNQFLINFRRVGCELSFKPSLIPKLTPPLHYFFYLLSDSKHQLGFPLQISLDSPKLFKIQLTMLFTRWTFRDFSIFCNIFWNAQRLRRGWALYQNIFLWYFTWKVNRLHSF